MSPWQKRKKKLKKIFCFSESLPAINNQDIETRQPSRNKGYFRLSSETVKKVNSLSTN